MIIWYNLKKSLIFTKIVGNDPKYNTSIQRSWNYIQDPGMRSIEELGINNTVKLPVPQEDNFLSLPLGSKLINFIILFF